MSNPAPAFDAHFQGLLRQVEQMGSVLSGGGAVNGLEPSAFRSEFANMLWEDIAGER